MSQENVETSERVWAMFMAGEIESMLAVVDQKAEIHNAPEVPGARVFHGPEGWRQQIESFSEAFTDLRYERLESIDCGETVIAVIHTTGMATYQRHPGRGHLRASRDLARRQDRAASVLHQPPFPHPHSGVASPWFPPAAVELTLGVC